MYLELLIVFLKIGLFGFGGGYAILPLIQYEIVEHHRAWITMSEFMDILAISQMTPGPVAINTATYVGWVVTGNIWGSIIATVGVCLPPFLIMLSITRFYFYFKKNQKFMRIMSFLKPVVVALIASAAASMMNEHNFTDYYSLAFFLIAFFASIKSVHPVILIIMAGIAGVVIY